MPTTSAKLPLRNTPVARNEESRVSSNPTSAALTLESEVVVVPLTIGPPKTISKSGHVPAVNLTQSIPIVNPKKELVPKSELEQTSSAHLSQPGRRQLLALLTRSCSATIIERVLHCREVS